MKRLIASWRATTVAQWLPASGETRQANVGHDFLLRRCPQANTLAEAWRRRLPG